MNEKTYITIEQRFYNELLAGKVIADALLNLLRKKGEYGSFDMNEVQTLYAMFIEEGR